ncbi:MAG: tetratricopeptide repeat protein [Litorimonas sp.]
MKTALLATTLALCPALAHAQTVVIGQGAAQSCYQSAMMGDMGSRSAIRTCSEAFERGMSSHDKTATYVNRGVLQMRRGDLDKAVADYEKALDRDPKLAEAHINHGVVLYLQGDDAEALEAYNTAIALGTDKMAEALYNRALVYDRMENARGAYYDLKSVLALKPDWEDAKTALGRYTVVSNKES